MLSLFNCALCELQGPKQPVCWACCVWRAAVSSCYEQELRCDNADRCTAYGSASSQGSRSVDKPSEAVSHRR